ncbi:hypothetical protein MJN54_31190, partial [Salmonella enterica subsp. enterica serovar Kentucky]|nr:hypothetical protein [Salmonella enterica subsp. enterica serovar Kentucky]
MPDSARLSGHTVNQLLTAFHLRPCAGADAINLRTNPDGNPPDNSNPGGSNPNGNTPGSSNPVDTTPPLAPGNLLI